MSIWKTAWRNVWRNKRRSIVTIAAMTLALFVLVIWSGLIEGYMRGMERNIVDIELGDIQIHAQTFLDRPSKYTTIDDASELLERFDAAGITASARLLAGALAGTEQTSAGVALRGIDVRRDAAVSRIHEAIATGQWLSPEVSDGVVIGRRLARNLGVEVGDELVVMTQAMDGGMADGLYIVRGILMGIAEGTDRAVVFMNEGAFRELMAFPSGAHQIVVKRPAGADLDVLAGQIRSMAPEHDVRTWRQLMPLVAQMLDSTRGLLFIIFFIVYLAVAILIVNAMLMAVFERIREFGVFKAIGGGPGRVFFLVIVEAVIQVAIAAIIGTGLALPAMWFLSSHGIDVGALGGTSIMGVAMDSVWFGVFSVQSVTSPLVMLFFMALVGVLYPAAKAAWIRPVEAMRHQ